MLCSWLGVETIASNREIGRSEPLILRTLVVKRMVCERLACAVRMRDDGYVVVKGVKIVFWCGIWQLARKTLSQKCRKGVAYAAQECRMVTIE